MLIIFQFTGSLQESAQYSQQNYTTELQKTGEAGFWNGN